MAGDRKLKSANLSNLQEEFKKRLQFALDKVKEKNPAKLEGKTARTWLQEELAKHYDDDLLDELPTKSTIENWFKAKNIPRAPTLVALSKILETPIDAFFGMPTPYPHLKLDDYAYSHSKASFLEHAQTEVYFQFTTGRSFDRDHDTTALHSAIERSVKAKRDFKIKLLLCDPYSKQICHEIGQRRTNRKHFTFVQADIEATIMDFIDLALGTKLVDFTNPTAPDNLQIVTIPYIPAATVCIVDPNHVDSKLHRMSVLQSNFGIEPLNAPSVELYRSQHGDVFDWYYRDFTRMWEWGQSEQIQGDVSLTDYWLRIEGRDPSRDE